MGDTSLEGVHHQVAAVTSEHEAITVL
ncbi:MAG: hypothetical protein RLZZ228_738, partial [Actinomycetota bacterium]